MPIPVGDRPFDKLAAGLAADELAASPTLGSVLGLTEYDEALPDMAESSIAARCRRDDDWLERFRALGDDELDQDERIDRDLVLTVLRGRQIMRDWADWRRSPDHYAGVALNGVFGLLTTRVRPEAELAQAVAARLRATPELLDQGEHNLDPALADAGLVRRGLGLVQAGASYARALAVEFPDGALRAEVAAAGELAAAAFERFGLHLATLADQSTGAWAIGERRYDALLRESEGLGYGARELRARGQAAYDEIEADLRARTLALRGNEDWRGLLEEISLDAPATPEEMLDGYTQVTARAREFCRDNDLVTMPVSEQCEVLPSAPFLRAMVAVAHYMAPPPFAGASTGHFFVPYPPDGSTPDEVAQRLATNNRAGQWSITVHEAYPGHHWHFAHLASRPIRPLRAVFGSPYFVEGWGLYSEDLMRERGFFTTPEQELCQRDMRLFRAARIIVDTSLHLGDMTVEAAVDFMSTKSSLSVETARAEVLRYCAWPTQASAYLTGALEIARMRRRWESEGRGPLREFHDLAAGSGRLPISLVERAVFD